MIDGKITEKGYALTIAGLAQIDDKVIGAMKIGLANGLETTVGVVKREFLQGPRPVRLGEITGRLLGSITQKVSVSGNTVRGQIGTNLVYGAYHEFGFHGTENVRQFTRKLSQREGIPGTPVVLGQPFPSAKQRMASKRRTAKAIAAHFEEVKAHTRKVDYAGRPFVAPALQKSLPLIITAVKKQLETIKPTP